MGASVESNDSITKENEKTKPRPSENKRLPDLEGNDGTTGAKAASVKECDRTTGKLMTKPTSGRG